MFRMCNRNLTPEARGHSSADGLPREAVPPDRPSKRPRVEGRQLKDVNDVFDFGDHLGRGSYGVVIKAQYKMSDKVVALKFIEVDPADNNSGTHLREMRILGKLKHDNIIGLIDVMTGRFSQDAAIGLVFVFECMSNDMAGARFLQPALFTPDAIQWFIYQLLKGLAHAHAHKIMHRDLKPANILLSDKGILKIADFGLATECSPESTPGVVTEWYRSPELLLASDNYTESVDVWSVGCIFREIITGDVLFGGHGQVDMLNLIFGLCGCPSADTEGWYTQSPEAAKALEPYVSIPTPTGTFSQRLGFPESPATKLSEKFLSVVPGGRISAEDALKDIYFNGVTPVNWINVRDNFEAKADELGLYEKFRAEQRGLVAHQDVNLQQLCGNSAAWAQKLNGGLNISKMLNVFENDGGSCDIQALSFGTANNFGFGSTSSGACTTPLLSMGSSKGDEASAWSTSRSEDSADSIDADGSQCKVATEIAKSKEAAECSPSSSKAFPVASDNQFKLDGAKTQGKDLESSGSSPAKVPVAAAANAVLEDGTAGSADEEDFEGEDAAEPARCHSNNEGAHDNWGSNSDLRHGSSVKSKGRGRKANK